MEAHRRILIDSNVLIAYFEGGQQITPAAVRIVDRWIREGRNPGIVSVVSVMELLVGAKRASRGESDLLDFFGHFPNLHVQDVNTNVAKAASTIRAESNLKTPDALIVASGIEAGAEAIVTNDGVWEKQIEIPVVTLKRYCP